MSSTLHACVTALHIQTFYTHTHTQFLKCTMIKIMKTFVNKCISLVSKLVLVNFPYDNVKYTLN